MKLTVENFQIHQKPKTVDIPEGETTYLEGDSDIGKSALMRAMRWLCENKPDGGSFVTFKQPRGTTSVVTLEADGRSVTRERGKSKNLYKLDDETFEAFGRSVPEPIAKFLNLSPYAFQLQGEVPFLIGASPTDAAKILSDACGLGVIDTAVQFVRQKKTLVDAEIRKSEILLESAQGRLATATEQLPLADALETAAGLGDEATRIDDRVCALEDAIVSEPSGEVLDTEHVKDCAALAHLAAEGIETLTARALNLRRALQNEPAGVLFDISAVFPIADALHEIVPALAGMHDRAARISQSLANEPTGALHDVSAAKPLAVAAGIRWGEVEELHAHAVALNRAIQNEPVGEIRDVSRVLSAVARARATIEERAILSEMCHKMRHAVYGEPQGDLMSTTELEQQRAQIKVCPTCGRELP